MRSSRIVAQIGGEDLSSAHCLVHYRRCSINHCFFLICLMIASVAVSHATAPARLRFARHTQHYLAFILLATLQQGHAHTNVSTCG